MVNFRKAALAGALAAILAPAVAFAADPPPPPTPYIPPPVEYGSKWYVRIDGGLKWYRDPVITFNEPTLGYDVPGLGEMLNESISRSWLIGAGIGFQMSNHFRTDLTIDYEWPGEIYGELECPSCGPPQYSIETADLSVLTILANFYFDLPMSHGFTPYVGVGLGVARLTTSNVAFVNPDLSTGTWEGASTWNFAWALMAGVEKELDDNWSIDASYRYLHLGDAMAITTLGPTGDTPIVYSGIAAHEFRIGLRYSIW
ncbi:MAG: porin family protein [Bauldia sp.]|nr:porin family protein [Bauldia sp.]